MLARLMVGWLLIAALGCNATQPPAPARDETVVAKSAPSPPPPAAPEPATEPEPPPSPPAPTPAIDPSWKTHTDKRSKVSFRYPSDYLFQQTRTRADESAVVLMTDDRFARDYVAGKLKGQPTEGPQQMSFWLRKIELKGQTLEDFVRDDMKKAQNEAALETVQVGGKKAFAYATDGLWQGRTVVLEGPEVLIQAHVDFNAPEDRFRKDFDTILSSLTW